MLKSLKKLISAILVLGLIFSSPILMDHVRDVYLNEIASRKAHPVSYRGKVFGSSFQLRYKKHSLTVTNYHVCQVVEEIQRAIALEELDGYLTILFMRGIPPEYINKIYLKRKNEIMRKKYPIIGEYVTVGEFNRKILYTSKSHDICFLEPLGSLTFSLASFVHRGERITIIGHPRGESQSISDGRIVGESWWKPKWLPFLNHKVRSLKTTAISYPGNSGSPIVNRYGNVVGILFSGRDLGYINVNGAVPLEYIRADFEQYLQESK